MSAFMIWLVGAFLFLLSMGVANRYLKVFCKKDLKTEDAVMQFIVGLILASALWPIAIFIIAVIVTVILFRKYFIPD